MKVLTKSVLQCIYINQTLKCCAILLGIFFDLKLYPEMLTELNSWSMSRYALNMWRNAYTNWFYVCAYTLMHVLYI